MVDEGIIGELFNDKMSVEDILCENVDESGNVND